MRIRLTELTYILNDLFANALRAMEHTDEPTVSIRIAGQDQKVLLEFSDNGCGIPDSLQEQIFSEDYTTRPDKKGGLGLHYARTTLTKYGGNIVVKESTVGQGTTFLIQLKKVK